ncbi:MAG: iron export ABC transporter permease subunit FetB [Microcoleaceae cyanobacterium]
MIALDFADLCLAMGLMGIAIALSAWQKLGLEWKLILATVRPIVQLAVVGYVLAVIFDTQADTQGVDWLVWAALLMLSGLVALVTRNRIGPNIPNLFLWVWGSLVMGAILHLLYVHLFIIQPPSAVAPQYWIPLVAMVLGTSMNSAVIFGQQLVKALTYAQAEIETHLSLGATPQQAIVQCRREAIRAGLIPSLNSMMIVGIITLPGFLSGELLAGASPLDAVSYQILILFLSLLASLIVILMLSHGIYRQFFNREAQLRQY